LVGREARNASRPTQESWSHSGALAGHHQGLIGERRRGGGSCL
jgi:hypothetical protein